MTSTHRSIVSFDMVSARPAPGWQVAMPAFDITSVSRVDLKNGHALCGNLLGDSPFEGGVTLGVSTATLLLVDDLFRPGR